MKIGLRGGHSPNCKGAIGIIDEQVEVRKIYNELKPMLERAGHTVVNCNSDEKTQKADLAKGTDTANANKCDIFVSLHMNKFNKLAKGTEVWIHDRDDATLNAIADRICLNFKNAGFVSRGVKTSGKYHDLNKTHMSAMIVETLFCDSEIDVSLYRSLGTKGVANLIAEAILGRKVPQATAPSKPATPSKPSTSSSEMYRVRKTWADAKSQIGAYKDLNNAKEKCNQNKGYKVFNNAGICIYPTAQGGTATSFKVKVEVSALNVRKGAGTNYPRTTCIRDKGIYTITETKGGWGKLKSGAGWIYLNNGYTKRV